MLPTWYSEYKKFIEDSLQDYLEQYFQSEKNAGLDIMKEATYYAVSGGKRLRAILALEFYLSFSQKELQNIQKDDVIIKFCIALELLHAYSLVHDDLPAMDNDVLRRGEPTTWKKYGEANGILVGDLLNSLSFEILSQTGNAQLVQLFGEAVGLKGMLGGQVLDLFYEQYPQKLTLENLAEVHNKKTGALIQVAVIGGLLLANASQSQVQKYAEYGKKIGLAFQVKDDILDVEGTQEETGKSVGGEQKGFVYFLGLEKSKLYLESLIQESFELIEELNSNKLVFLTHYIQDRRK